MIISLVRLPCGNGQPTAEQHAGLLRRKDPLHQDVRAFLNRRHGLDGRRDIVAVEVVPAALTLWLENEIFGRCDGACDCFVNLMATVFLEPIQPGET